MRRLYLALLPYRRLVNLVIHVALIVAANYIAFWLRFDGDVPPETVQVRDDLLPILIAVRLAVFVPFHLFEGLWRYTSIWDVRRIGAGVAVSSGLFYLVVHHWLERLLYPRSIFLIDALVLAALMGAARLGRRIAREIGSVDRGARVLIYGAGDAADLVLRDLQHRGSAAPEVIGVIDDDPHKVGHRLHGVPVLGSREDLARIVKANAPTEILIAIPSASEKTIRAIVRALEPFHLRIRTVPSLNAKSGQRPVDLIRDLSVEDLLARAPVGLDPTPLRDLISGRRVLVTGAGGSIGSELCRQIAGFSPAHLVVLDRYENGLFEVLYQLQSICAADRISGVIADITDQQRIEEIVARHRPELVFHAAAHKHVPLMELNPCEAVKNNVRGTRIVAQACARHEVGQFILISTDKAVNPTSVMGATKRAAERIVRAVGEETKTNFVIVRFGNVLGSNGSVVPRFVEQIRKGGPVTITHPEIRRFFMLIPEAVQLVLHAAALRERGCVYILEMGEQIKLVDLARDLIRLSGFIPEAEIPITFVGLRPGEKLSEELVASDEVCEPSYVSKVMRVRSTSPESSAQLVSLIARLEDAALAGHAAETLGFLQLVVPAFTTSSEAAILGRLGTSTQS